MTGSLKNLIALGLVVTSIASPLADQPLKFGETLDSFSLYDTQRRARSLDDYESAKAVAVIFGTTECPLVNLYLPTLKTLHQQYHPKGTALLMVNPDPGDSFNRVAGHAWEHQLPFPVLKDFDQKLARRLGASRTPEVFLFDEDRQLVYRGRIDDQYTVTHRRPVAGTHDFRQALDQVLAGEVVSQRRTKATGCVIDYASNSYDGEKLTYTEDIASMVASKCLECHRKGQVGQISFTTYRQVKRFSKTIREVISEQRMPPWHADPEYGVFMNNRSLSDDQRDRFIAWIDQGCPEGEGVTTAGGDEVSAPWSIGTPDLILEMPEEQVVPASGVVDYRYVTIDPGFTEDVWIQAAEAKPGNAEVVHHVIAYIVEPGKRVFDRDGETAILVGWAPGDMPAEYPEGVARRIAAGSEIRFELHYTPNGKETTDLSRVGIKFASDRPQREIHTNIMWQRELRIPPGVPRHSESSTYTFRDDAQILSLMPRMHLRGVAARYLLQLPDGKQKTLLSVPSYDFNWQSVYRFEKPIPVPKGAQLTVTGVWDNSADNPNNPDASRTVPWGEQTWDEMLNGWVDFVYDRPLNDREVAVVR